LPLISVCIVVGAGVAIYSGYEHIQTQRAQIQQIQADNAREQANTAAGLQVGLALGAASGRAERSRRSGEQESRGQLRRTLRRSRRESCSSLRRCPCSVLGCDLRGGQVKRGLIAVAVALLAGCVHAPPPPPVVQVLAPPDGLLQDCQHAPRPAGDTMEDLAQAVINERGVVESCDWADKAALRAWKARVTASGK
jgi:hypothetical protein